LLKDVLDRIHAMFLCDILSLVLI